MSYTVSRIQITGFRNYREFVLEPDPSLTVLVGPNAVGKTNLIEAVQLVTEARSFRNPSWSDTVNWESKTARVRLDAIDGDRVHAVEMEITSAGRRAYRVNGKPKRVASDVSGIVPCVLFTPDDLGIVKNSAERRRELLDDIGTQLSKTYTRLKSEYDRVVRHRNALLREDRVNEGFLSSWDERLVTLGARLVSHRMGLFQRLTRCAGAIYEQIADDGPLVARYVPSWERAPRPVEGSDPASSMRESLVLNRADEKARGTTLIGPHRDEITFSLGGKEARSFASQGQQRTIALALKLAEVDVVADVTGSRPILLLDDVMSELDERRRDAFTRLVGDTAQTIITTTNLGYFEEEVVKRSKVVMLD